MVIESTGMVERTGSKHNKLKAPSAYQRSSKCMKTSKKSIYKIVFVSKSINRDMVLKWKLGQLVRTDLLPLKRISFSSTPPSFDSTVITLSKDIVHKFEEHLCRKNVDSLYFSRKQTSFNKLINHFRFLLLSFSCFVYRLSDWQRSHCVIYAVQLAESWKMPHCFLANQITRKKMATFFPN